MKDSGDLIHQVANPDQFRIGRSIGRQRRWRMCRGHAEILRRMTNRAIGIRMSRWLTHLSSAKVCSTLESGLVERQDARMAAYGRAGDGLAADDTSRTSAQTTCSLRMTISTRRFCARPCAVSLLAMGWYSAYPAAESRSGENRYRRISRRTSSVERAVESSQLDSICRV